MRSRLTKIVGILGLNVEGGGVGENGKRKKGRGVSCNCLLETQKIIEKESTEQTNNKSNTNETDR